MANDTPNPSERKSAIRRSQTDPPTPEEVAEILGRARRQSVIPPPGGFLQVGERCRCGDDGWEPHQHCRKSTHGDTCCHCGCEAIS